MSVLHRFGLQGGGTVEPWHGLGSWTSWMCWVLCTLQNRALYGHGDTLMLQTVKYTLRNGLDAAHISGRARRQSSLHTSSCHMMSAASRPASVKLSYMDIPWWPPFRALPP